MGSSPTSSIQHVKKKDRATGYENQYNFHDNDRTETNFGQENRTTYEMKLKSNFRVSLIDRGVAEKNLSWILLFYLTCN